MKKIIFITIFSLISFLGFSQVTNNFEDGNWLYYYNLCWGIGPNSTYFGTKVTGNGFNGTDVCETDNLGQTSICRLETPWIELQTGNITFTHAIPSFDGVRTLKVYIYKPQNLTPNLIYTHNYSNSKPVNAVIYSSWHDAVYKLRFEWTGSKGNSRGQLDNIVIPGENVSDPSNNCNPFVPPPPSDTIVNYYPASDTSTLAFEDLWPYYGDYDMNDLVIDYKFKIKSFNGYVTSIDATFIVRADGAGLHNGFGFQLPILPSDILSVAGTGDQNGYTISSNGTEFGQSKATFIIFDDQYKFMTSWNTVKGEPTCPPFKFDVRIKFDPNKVTLQQLSIQNWNPFIVAGGVRGMEIHLPNYLPTDLVDPSIFNTGDDNTIVGTKYYKSKTNLPWAIDIYGKFDYPVEKADVSHAYLHFQDWIHSNGTQYQDWWLNTSSGYRDNNLIY